MFMKTKKNKNDAAFLSYAAAALRSFGGALRTEPKNLSSEGPKGGAFFLRTNSFPTKNKQTKKKLSDVREACNNIFTPSLFGEEKE